MSDTVVRFDGLAQGYDRFRPTYPDAAIDFLISHCRLAPGSRFVDVGCGTGISTRLFASRNLRGIGIDPNADMRRIAEFAGGPIEYRAGSAEATGLPDASAELVLAAQAFHWFPADAALAEFHRLLVPGGWVALLWNDVDRGDPLSGSFAQALVDTSPEPQFARWVQSETGAALMTNPRFGQQERREFANEQPMDFDQLLGRAMSASFAPKADEPRRELESALRRAFDAHQRDGRVTMRYRTVVYVGRKSVPRPAEGAGL